MPELEDRSADRPVCVLLVICNDVIEDKSTNSKSLIGLFNAVAAFAVPTQQAKMSIVASVTNIRGTDIPAEFVIHDPNDTSLLKTEAKITSANPLEVHDLVIRLLGFPLTMFGAYRLELSVGGQYLLSRTFNVTQMKIPGMNEG